MNKEFLKEKYKTEYQKYLIDHFADTISDDVSTNESYHKHYQFLFVLSAPEDYGVEDKMLEFISNNSDISIQDLDDYFDEIVPPGEPPCTSEWEADEDDE